MISYDEALKIIRTAGAGKLLGTEAASIEELAGRIAAEYITAPIANQPFDNAAMDGYALRAEELASANNDNPVSLEVAGRVAAGDKPPVRPPAHGQCYEIMTGAPLPPGCDTVVPVEKTEKNGKKALFISRAGKGNNIRRAGEDFAAGDILVRAGTVLHAGHVMVLATAGVPEIMVRKNPKTGQVSTGFEVIDELDAPLAPGQIYNSTGPYLRAALRQAGLAPDSYGTVRDEPAVYKEKLQKAVAARCDIILSTGAVSAGVYDFVPAVLRELGAEILFHKVAIRPGKPILFARFPDGGPFFFGLPGNPVSTAAGWRFFVQPLIREMQGLPPEEPQKAILQNAYSKDKADLRFFLRGRMRYTGKATLEVALPEKQASFMVSPFADTDVWAVLPEGVTRFEAGAIIEVYPLS